MPAPISAQQKRKRFGILSREEEEQIYKRITEEEITQQFWSRWKLTTKEQIRAEIEEENRFKKLIREMEAKRRIMKTGQIDEKRCGTQPPNISKFKRSYIRAISTIIRAQEQTQEGPKETSVSDNAYYQKQQEGQNR